MNNIASILRQSDIYGVLYDQSEASAQQQVGSSRVILNNLFDRNVLYMYMYKVECIVKQIALFVAQMKHPPPPFQ